MLVFIAKRLLGMIPVLMIVAVIVFMIVRLTPGDPAAIIGGNGASSDDLARIRTQLGLTLPLWQQFGIWCQHMLSGDLGYSFFLNTPVSELIEQRLGPTLSLTLLTLVLTVVIAVPLGTLAASHMGGWLDRAVMAFSVAGFSIPVFVIGYVLIYFLSVKTTLLPVQGYQPLSAGFWDWLRHLILPCLSLSITYVALLARMTRAAVSEALTEDYIRTARAKGIDEWQVVTAHALRNAAVPVATVIGISAALLLGGVVVTETVFAVPGLGQLTVDAVLNRDFPVLQGVVLFFALAYMVVNMVVDISYLVLDPRIRY
ncbi:ABC transporter permease [Prodigiosinella confusarubida]|uniref:ABC transporter permease n=1 Tax=Serratia sp. (strain ATCC 39006) TaxID=104623 RepID=A0A2I5TE77_SERS3|nr:MULTISPECIES: ABC transporter permease [Enterobacterales]AUG98555.1 ABC transporter permease [Serratia sp. ATCC 39006]AUH02870.1 ABC transporter permease [Serratia sp. ATCC 39006]